VIDTGRFRFRAVPGDIEAFNRRAIAHADYDVTALSARAYAECAHTYAITRVGSSFGEGYGPKVVARKWDPDIDGVDDLKRPDVTIAVPGHRTTAFMTLGLMLGRPSFRPLERFEETPFDRIIPRVVDGEVSCGLVIHEGQVQYEQAGLRLIVDLGTWWKTTRNLPLPLGVNAVRRDLDQRFGPGSVAEVGRILDASVRYACLHRAEGLEYTMEFARVNARTSGVPEPTLAQVDHYVSLYVTDLTRDLGTAGRDAIDRLLREGAAAGLCPAVAPVDPV
jgi:1,4-dihydroxy-6-naphthoate synthase